ncbi:MAG: hypothetical protein AAF960_22870 [Bacteroidota bacterium]
MHRTTLLPTFRATPFTGNAVVNQNGVASNQVKVDLSGLPIVISIQDGGCQYDKDGRLDNCSNDATVPSGSGDGGTLVSCGEININYGGNWISWKGKNEVKCPKVELIKVTNNQYKIVKTCPFNCGDNGRFTDLEAGDYLLKVFQPSWTLACKLNQFGI